MPSLFYFAVCLVGWGIATFLMTFVTRQISIGTILICNLIGYCISISIVAKGIRFELKWAHLLAILIGVLFVLCNTAYYKLSEMGGQASVLAPLTGLYVLFPVVLGAVLLKERMFLTKSIGIALAVVAIYLLSLPEKGAGSQAAQPSAAAEVAK